MSHAGNTREAPSAAVIAAHPDDETLWAGGFILAHPDWNWHIITLCRASDPDRAPKFSRAMEYLGAAGRMGDMDDGPDQHPLSDDDVDQTILSLLPARSFDVILTHGPSGEYTRHLRHEEVCRAAVSLWNKSAIQTRELYLFAYNDGGKKYLPKADPDAPIQVKLPEAIWQKKYDIITRIFGFTPESFEVRTTPRYEAFWLFHNPRECQQWMEERQSLA